MANRQEPGRQWASQMALMVKHPPANARDIRDTTSISRGPEDLLEEFMATHSSSLVCRIPWTEEPDRLQATRSQRVGQD